MKGICLMIYYFLLRDKQRFTELSTFRDKMAHLHKQLKYRHWLKEVYTDNTFTPIKFHQQYE